MRWNLLGRQTQEDKPAVLPSRRAILTGSLAGGVLGVSGVSLAASSEPSTAPREPMGRSPFPRDFAWGVATSAYQVEGAVTEDGRGPSVWDVFVKRPGAIYEGQTGDFACDHYHRFKEDVALMKRLGAKAYRFSVSWTRVLPEGTGTRNPNGFDFYHRLIDELGRAGVQPVCTLFHWDFPQTLYQRGGWLNRDSASWFADYVGLVADKLGDRVKHWITLNEPQAFVGMGHRDGVDAPGDKLKDPQYLTVAHNALRAHA